MHPFVEACELEDGISVEVALEELLYEIVENHIDHKDNETFDIRIIDKAPSSRWWSRAKDP